MPRKTVESKNNEETQVVKDKTKSTTVKKNTQSQKVSAVSTKATSSIKTDKNNTEETVSTKTLETKEAPSNEEKPNWKQSVKTKQFWLNMLMIASIVVLGVLIWNTSLSLYYKNADAVAVMNGKVIKAEDITNGDETVSVNPEMILDYARREAIKEKMDESGVVVPTNEVLEKEKVNYIGEGTTWEDAATSQQMTVEALKESISFYIRLTEYRNKILGEEAASLVEPAYPSEETSEAVAAYNTEYSQYQSKMTEYDAKWTDHLDSVFSDIKLTIFSLKL